MGLRIREYAPDDGKALRDICRQSAASRPFVPLSRDPELGPLLYLDPYLATEPESCFVAESDGRVVGYIAGTVDTLKFRRAALRYQRSRLPRLLRHVTRQTLRGHYSNRSALRSVVNDLRAILRGGSGYGQSEVDECVDLSRYPAHCHLQLAPEHRGGRVGLSLVMKFQKYLKSRGVAGQHSSVSAPVDDDGYCRLMKSLRFETVREHTFDRHSAPYLEADGTWVSRVMTKAF